MLRVGRRPIEGLYWQGCRGVGFRLLRVLELRAGRVGVLPRSLVGFAKGNPTSAPQALSMHNPPSSNPKPEALEIIHNFKHNHTLNFQSVWICRSSSALDP